MDDGVLVEDLPLPPTRLFARLAQIQGYIWDQSVGRAQKRLNDSAEDMVDSSIPLYI